MAKNNSPVITSTATQAAASITELAAVTGSTVVDTVTNTLTFTDLDTTDTHTVSFTPQAAGFIGTFTPLLTHDSTGGVTGSVQWTFTVSDGALDFLAAGQTLVQSYTVTIADNRGGTVTQVVTVTLTGTNDAPTITSTVAAATGAVTELAGVTGSAAVDAASGTLTFKDVDLTDTHAASFAPPGAGYLGSFTLGALSDSTNGATGSVGWTFSVADGALDFLAAGQTLVQSYNVTVADNHGGTVVQVVTVTLTGTNDAPTITSTLAAAAGAVTELAGVTGSTATDSASGALTFKDVDLTDTHTATAVAQGTGYLGSFTLGTVSDSTGGATGSVGWNFSVVDGALDFLAAGQTLVQKYNVTVADNHGGTVVQVVTVALTGTNDAPVITSTAAAATGSVTELAAVTASPAVDIATGTLTFTDVDLLDIHTVSAVAQGTGYIGALTFGAVTEGTSLAPGSVAWTFSTPDGALDFLAAGQTLLQSYTVTVADNHGGTAAQVVTVTIIGTNDAPTITSTAAAATGSVTELAGVSGSTATDLATGTLTFKDVDLIDTHTATVVAQGAGYLGNFTLGAIADSTGGVTGSVGWTFSVVDGALDFLAAGQTLVQSYNVTVADNHGGTAVQVVTVTLTGTTRISI
jgi:VCBS repeat-containing protein